jgi:hypothetical protein
LIILTGIMCGVAAAATLARGMRQLPTPSRAGKHPGNQPAGDDRNTCRTTSLNSS